MTNAFSTPRHGIDRYMVAPRQQQTNRRVAEFVGLFRIVISLFGLFTGIAVAATDTFVASGTWTAPAGVTLVTVEAWGGGGAGGGQNQNSDGGGGGGGGAYSKKYSIPVTPSTTYSFTVGAGGVAVAGGTGGVGGDTFFISTSTVLAKGGAGGLPSTGTPPASVAGGAAVAGVGDVKFSGGNGGQGRNNGTGRGGPGGSSAGTAANGTAGLTPWNTTNAVAAPIGGGIGGNGGAEGSNGAAPASGNGGGGGGAGEGTSRFGGGGAAGKITISYFPCLPPPNIPSEVIVSCQCDAFQRAVLNPSTIFGSNWIVSTSDATAVLPRLEDAGYLRLTDNSGNNAKAATVPGIFPAAGNYISVEFQQYAYNGSGADGIAVTLSDYAIPAVPGAYGGSLGYAQETGIHDGFAGGWLGVAMDEYGNYQNPTEGRLGGQGFIVQSVGARGSGVGQTGYRWLGGTSTLSPEIDNNGSAARSRGYNYQVVVDARNEPTSTAIAVNRDTGGGYASLISIPNVYTAATSQGFTQASVPANWQISFTGSTGGSTNIHEIGNLRICASSMAPPGGGIARGFNAIDEAYGTPPGVDVQNYLTGHIYTKLVGTPFKLNVAALDNSQIVTTYAAGSAKTVTVKLVDNSDSLLDSSKDCSLSCTSACTSKATVTGGTQTLTFTSGATDKGQKQSPNFTVNTAYQKLVAIISDGTTAACSTNTFSVRPLSIASVESNAINTAIFKAGSDNFSLIATTTGVTNSPGGYTGVLKINSAGVAAASPATVAGSIVGSFPAAISGTSSSVATGTAFTYSEVGAFNLMAPDFITVSRIPGIYDDSWTAVDSGVDQDCVSGSTADAYSNNKNATGKYGCNFGISANTAAFGRFIPYEFRVSNPVLTNRQTAACSPASAFSYLDEGMGLSYTLEARSATGNITRNYAGTLAKLTLPANASTMNFASAVVAPVFTTIDSNRIVGSAFTGSWPVQGDFSAGQMNVAGTVTISSLTNPTNNRVAPDGPFTNASLGIAPVDDDGVRILGYDLDSDNSGGANGPDRKTIGPPTTLYFGELRMLPAIGSELLPLTMKYEILRWSGFGFVTNGDDNCTQVPAARLGLSSWTKNLAVGGTTPSAGALTFAGGRGALLLSSPGAGADGSVLVKTCLITDTNAVGPCAVGAGLPYLTGRWRGADGFDQNPSAVASFGLRKGSGQIIHFQENF